jgi:hypothetical protein
MTSRCGTQPIRCAPLGKPRRKTTEPAPLSIPEEWPTVAPAEPVQIPSEPLVPA